MVVDTLLGCFPSKNKLHYSVKGCIVEGDMRASFRLVVELILCIPMSIDELCLCEVGMDTDGGYIHIHIIRMGSSIHK